MKNISHGFTLVELMVTVVVAGVTNNAKLIHFNS